MRLKQILTIGIAIGVFSSVAITGIGGLPLLIIAGIVAVALVDGTCRALDRQSALNSQGAFSLESSPEVRLAAPGEHAAHVQARL